MGSRTGRHYTPEEKHQATERARLIGAGKASIELGVPAGTLSCWIFHARQTEGGTVASSAAAAELAVPVVPVPPTVPVAKAEEAGLVPPPARTVAGTRRARVAKVYTPSSFRRWSGLR